MTRNSTASRDAPLNRWGHALPAVGFSVALVFLCFPDVGLDWLVWISLVPLFLAARGAGARRGFLLGWLFGILAEGLCFLWLLPSLLNYTGRTAYSVVLAVILFLAWLLYSAVSWGALGWLLGRCRTPSTVHAAIAVWVGVEHYFPRLFPWHLGGVFYDREWLRQGADIFGTSGLSYLVLLANALVYLLIEWGLRRSAFPRVTSGVAVLLILAANVYGAARFELLRRDVEAAPQLRVGVIQPLVEPGVKHDRGEKGSTFFKSLLRQTHALSQTHALDLILWPEGTNYLPFDPEEGKDPLASHRDEKSGKMLFDGIDSPLVIGGGSLDSRKRTWNTAAYVLPAGEAFHDGSRARLYHKNVRMLLGEKLPFQEYLPEQFRRGMKLGNVQAGKTCPVFALPWRTSQPRPDGRISFPFRILICYEATLPGYVRKASENIDFLVNITEDIWYGKTAHIAQHASVIRMRTVENRVPLVRCTNVGPSGVVDVTGSFADSTDIFVPAEKALTLRPGRYFSFYRAYGFLFPLVSLILGALFFVSWRFRGPYPGARDP